MFQLLLKVQKAKKPFLGMPLIWLRKLRLLCISLNSTSEKDEKIFLLFVPVKDTKLKSEESL